MTSFRWLRARPRAVASAGIVLAGTVAITTMAFVYQGKPTTQVELNDGGVWVTKQSALMMGHLNHESQVLDGGLAAASDRYDILQAGTSVVVHDESSSSASLVDPAAMRVSTTAKLPASADVELGANAVAILDNRSGALWVTPAAALGAFRSTSKPLAKLGTGAAVTVGRDGTVFAVSPSRGKVLTIPTDAQGTAGTPQTQSFDGLDASSQVSITAVGTTPVVLDTAHSRVLAPGMSTSVDGADQGVLQLPGEQNESVLIATPSALERVPLDGRKPTGVKVDGIGVPAAPVYMLGCGYGAWSGTMQFVRDCPGSGNDLMEAVPDADGAAQLRFRVNRTVVVLNDIIGGAVWLAADSMEKIDNWSDLAPPKTNSEQEQTEDTSTQTTLPKRTDKNTPPTAADDTFGARAGRTTALPVLHNDNDPDGDVLTVSLPDGGPDVGTVVSIDKGSAFQIALPADASGSESISYQVDDGRGGTARATIHLTVVGADANSAPKQDRVTTVQVEAGGSVTYNALPDWIDPDGDDMFLANVSAMPGDQVDFTPDGRLTYRAISGLTGVHDIPVQISDGSAVGQGVVRLDIRPTGTTDPVANADHVVVVAGQSITVSPLANDVSSSSDPLRLTRVTEVPGASVVPDYANSTFTFRADATGTYYVQYEEAARGRPASSVVRVDVIEDSATSRPPVAVRDVALLPAGGEVLVDVLANDTDPGGGVLVVQSVNVPAGSGISASIVNHDDIRIADQGSLDGGQLQLTYTVSNGAASATGQVSIIKVTPPAKLRPPVANDDTAVVRVGDVVSIPVLKNDYSPTGSQLHVAPDLVPPVPADKDGEAFVSQDAVRFRAALTPKTVHLTYEVVDENGQKAAAYVTIEILPLDAETDQAPRPLDLTGRVISGTQTRIPVPLDGIDADGDSVELIGITSSPTKGRIVEVGADYLTYEAFEDSKGVDAFTYAVRDRLGKEGTATVRVGIAPPPSANHAPYAIKDSVVMRPGRQVAVPVLANDSDPDGDTVHLTAGGVTVPDVAGLTAEVVGDRVVVTSPDRELTTTIQYTVADSLGMSSVGVVEVKVDKAVPLVPPIARDDRVRAQDVGKNKTSVDVAVLANDEDPDGTAQDLVVTAGSGGKVLAGGKVRVQVTAEQQIVDYTVTDPDGQSATAFIFVPSQAQLLPSLATTTPVSVKSGEQVVIPLADHIVAAGGKTVRITEAAKVRAVNSDGSDLVKDPFTLVYRSAPQYVGDDAITLEVTDGAGPDDPDGRKATLTIPIKVTPPSKQSPTFTNGQLDIAPGEPASAIDLRALTHDTDPSVIPSIRYSVEAGLPAGITASVAGGTLKVAADASVKKGTDATVQLRISDGVTPAASGSIVVHVTASTRPLPAAADDTVPDAHQGTAITVPVLDNDFNPFPDTALKIIGVAVETGGGSIDPSISGGQVKVAIAANYVGTAIVRYRIQDATGDADRAVDGHIVITVAGRPEAPGTPAVSSVQDRTVVLSWAPPADNGSPITSYLVKATGGGYEKTCTATTCTLDGLTNNVEYNFTVTAVNAVGSSNPSPASETARPDARPDTPQAPTLAFGDKSLKVAWQTPTTPGSPVVSYNLEISPAPPSGVADKTAVTGNSLTWDGLENGVAYQVRVQAVNRAPDPSSWSSWSATEVPAKAPDAPAAPTTSMLSPVGDQAQIQVSWNSPASNGDAISGYELNVLQGGAVVQTIAISDGARTSQAVTMTTSTTDYTFAVRASNKAGWGAWSAASAPRRAVVTPGAPTGVSADPGDNSVTVHYTKGATNGATAAETQFQYSVSGGAWRSDWDGTHITSGVANNGTYTVSVRAVSTVDGQQYVGPSSAASNSVAPYGPVGTPTVRASASGTSITYAWSAPSANGRRITAMQISIDGGGWKDVSLNGNESHDYGNSETHSVRARAQDAAGQWSGVASDSGRTAAPPKARAWASVGPGVSTSSCSSATCAYGVLNVSNFPAGNYTLSCNGTGSYGGTWGERTYYVPANGSVQMTCYYGGRAGSDEFWVGIAGWGDSERVTWR